MGDDVDAAYVFGNFRKLLNASRFGDALHEGFRVEPSITGRFPESRMNLYQFLPVENFSHVADGEKGFDAAGTPCDDADGARGGDGRRGGVAHERRFGGIVNRPGIVGEIPACFAEVRRSRRGLFLDEMHDLFGLHHRIFGIVGNIEGDEHVGKAHDAEADLAIGAGEVTNLGEGILVGLDDVVQEMDGIPHHGFQMVVVDFSAVHHVGEVDGAEVARFVGQEGLFSARVGAFDFPDVRRGVVAVHGVQEDDAGFPVFPCRMDDQVVHLAGGKRRGFLLRAGVDEVVLLSLFHGFHEGVGDAHGKVEVRHAIIVGLAGDELLDVGVIDPKDPHIGSAPRAPLLDRFRRGIEDRHEGDRSAGDSLRGKDRVVFRAKTGEGKAGPAAALVDHGGVLDGFEDAVDGILHGEDEAGGKLPQGASRVHERRRIGDEVEGRHEPVELGGGVRDRIRAFELRVGLRDGVRHALEKIFGGFDGFVRLVFLQVAFFQYDERIGGKSQSGVAFHCDHDPFRACFVLATAARCSPGQA